MLRPLLICSGTMCGLFNAGTLLSYTIAGNVHRASYSETYSLLYLPTTKPEANYVCF